MNSRREIKSLLDSLSLSPKKSRGQNFLFELGAIEKVLRFINVDKHEQVLEIGPGLGAITAELISSSAGYLGIDVEERFVTYLKSKYSEGRLVQADIRKVSLAELGYSNKDRITVVSNVPYSISSEVILWILDQRPVITRASLLLQREFAERIAAKPGSKEYGSLTVLTSLYCEVTLGPNIKGTCFYPSTEVESRLIELRFLSSPRFQVRSRAEFERVSRTAFSKRRKTLLNAFFSSQAFGTRAQLEEVFHSVGIDPSRRAETLEVEEFARLTNALYP